MLGIKIAIGKIMKWDIRDFDLIRSGAKGGRPNWEIEHRKDHTRFAFTAFDSCDIHGLHEVVR